MGYGLDATVRSSGLEPVHGRRPGDPGLSARCEDRPWRAQVRAMVGKHVVPRLTHVAALAASGGTVARGLEADRVTSFAFMTLAADLGTLIRVVDALQGDGVALDEVLLHLLAPAARHLGSLWVENRLGFLEVTRATSMLQAVLRHFGREFEDSGSRPSQRRCLLLAPVPGEQHTFGLSLLAAFFRRSGWHVVFDARATEASLVGQLSGTQFDAVGLSASGNRFVDRLPALVDRLRQARLSQDCVFLAGGQASLDHARAGHDIGADAVAQSAADAVLIADRLTIGDASGLPPKSDSSSARVQFSFCEGQP